MIVPCFIEITVFKSNSVDPNQTPRSVLVNFQYNEFVVVSSVGIIRIDCIKRIDCICFYLFTLQIVRYEGKVGDRKITFTSKGDTGDPTIEIIAPKRKFSGVEPIDKIIYKKGEQHRYKNYPFWFDD